LLAKKAIILLVETQGLLHEEQDIHEKIAAATGIDRAAPASVRMRGIR
jgi:hypothetical protein